MKAEFSRVFLAIVATAGLMGAGAFPLRAAEDAAHGNADAGHTYANAVCAPCHAIEAGQKSSPEVKAPPFSAMVTNVKLTSQDIEGWLTSSHAGFLCSCRQARRSHRLHQEPCSEALKHAWVHNRTARMIRKQVRKGLTLH